MRTFLILIFIFSYSFLTAQSSYQFGWLPTLNFNKKLDSKWQWNFKIQSRQSFKTGIFNGPGESEYEYVLTDLAVIAARKIGLGSSLGAGYLIRFRDDRIMHRLAQQFAFVQKYPGFRLGHRIASDQSFESGEDVSLRFRYRLSLELPFNGQSVDVKEFYLKLNNEYLNGFQGEEYDLEIRIVPVIGYKFSDSNKLETGLDYRLSSFLDEGSKQRFWIGMSWYLVF